MHGEPNLPVEIRPDRTLHVEIINAYGPTGHLQGRRVGRGHPWAEGIRASRTHRGATQHDRLSHVRPGFQSGVVHAAGMAAGEPHPTEGGVGFAGS